MTAPLSHGKANTAALPDRTDPVAHDRLNCGMLAGVERRSLIWLAARTPKTIQPDHLTMMGVAGALLTMVGFVAANLSPFCVVFVITGLFLNWLGDSLDGTLARYRRIERPQLGYFIDHSCDLISQTLIFVGLGLSPYFTLISGFMALSMYFMMSSYTYIKVLIARTHHLSYGGMGATELRVALVIWSLFAIFVGPILVDARLLQFRTLDVVIGGLWTMVFLGFVALFLKDLMKYRAIFAVSVKYKLVMDIPTNKSRNTRETSYEYCSTGTNVVGQEIVNIMAGSK